MNPIALSSHGLRLTFFPLQNEKEDDRAKMLLIISLRK